MAGFSLKPLVLAFVGVLVGVILVGVIADSQVANTTLSQKNDTSVEITGGAGTLANVDVRSIIYFGNDTNSTEDSGVVIGTHVNLTNKNGSINVATNASLGNDNASLFSDGTYRATYSYEGDLFVKDTTTYPLLRLLALFFIIGIIALVVAGLRETTDNFNFGFK